MKKVLVFLVCIAMAVCVFSACSNKEDAQTTTATTKAASAQNELTTGSAVIKEADAINLVSSYSDKELGLTKEQRKSVSFMVSEQAVKIEKAYYIEVIATVKTAHKDEKTKKTTYTFDNQGVYYISFDGKKIMRKDMTVKEGEETKYIDMKMKAVPTTTAVNTTKKAETTTEKSKEKK